VAQVAQAAVALVETQMPQEYKEQQILVVVQEDKTVVGRTHIMQVLRAL
jgi:hypothetical protein